MSLKQQQHGRTGSLGQMPSSTLTGGAQGRSRTVHNGMRMKTGGGMNARGSAATPKPAAPVSGLFQYGHGQWGFINPKGLVNWNAKPPKAGQKVLGWNQVLPILQKRGSKIAPGGRNASPVPFADDLYARNMAQHDLDYRTAIEGGKYNQKQIDFELKQQSDDSTRKFQTDRESMSAALGGAGVGGSGISAGSMGLAQGEFQKFIENLTNEADMKRTKASTDMGLATTAHKAQKAAEIGLAGDRWKLENPGKKLPKQRTGIYTQGGRTYRTDPNTLITTTWTARPKRKRNGGLR